MSKIFYFSFFIFLILVSSLEAKIKIATWNVENLFDMVRNGTEYDEYIPNHNGWNRRILNIKLNHTSEVICDLDADIIALEEIENDNALVLLQKKLKRVGCPYPYRLITKYPKTSVHTALLSRIQIDKKRDIFIKPSGKYRSILEAIVPGPSPLYIFVNHWKSQSGPESIRVLYAKALARAIKRLPKGSEYILVGDFNSDYQLFRTIDKKLNNTHGFTGINSILKTTIDGRMVRFSDLKSIKRDSFIHYNLWMELPSSRRWSYNFYGKREAIDSIIIPPTLADDKKWEYIKGSFGVFKPKYLIGKYGYINRWRYRRNKHIGKGYSDHLPIYAYFDYIEPKGFLSKLFSFDNDEVKKNKQENISVSHNLERVATISLLKSKDNLSLPLELKDVTVILKKGKNAFLEDSNRDIILIYGADASIKEGYKYDLNIYALKNYRGNREITDFEVIKNRGKSDIKSFIEPFRDELMSNPKYIFHFTGNIKGVYNHRKIIINHRSYPIYFKNKRWTPSNGSSIYIKRAQISLYRGKRELIIWNRKDFKKEN